jgi:hypothetical protein
MRMTREYVNRMDGTGKNSEVKHGDAYEYIENSDLDELFVSDSVPLKLCCTKIKVISTVDIFGQLTHC